MTENKELKTGRHPEMLRIGVLLDSFIQPRWVEKVIQTIQTSDVAQIQLVVLNGSHHNPKSAAATFRQNRKYFAYKIYTRLDNLFFRLQPDAFARVNLEKTIAGGATLRVTPIQKKFSDYFPAEAIAA